MNLQSLLGEMPAQRFVADYYQRLPHSGSGAAQAFCSLGTWETVTALLAQDDADVLVCRRNEQSAGPRPKTADEARRLVDDGHTLLVRHAERCDERLAALAAQFAADLGGPVNIHVYCTPPDQFGFGWHYDAEEVFIVQTTGRKEYSLRKNTVNPWPVEETLPADMRYDREVMPLMKCELAAGDWLYIPSGYWHMGESRELAISLAIGVQPQTGIDVLDFLRRGLLESLVWRQRLPVAGRASSLSDEELLAAYGELLRALGADVVKRLADPQLATRLLAELRCTVATDEGGPMLD
ncbi:MAG: cupin domain-containing protein [Pirellulaceae bacterium]